MVAQFAARSTAIVMIALLAFSSAISQSGCPLSGADEKFLIERRRQVLGATILAQLGLQKIPDKMNTSNRTISKEQMDTFNALSQAAQSREQERQRQCQSEEVYAQPITTIVGKIEDSISSHNVRRRYAVEKNVLNTFDVEFNFILKEGLTSVTRGDIILYQLAPASTDNVLDQIQHVEIKAVFDSIGLKTVVAAKNVDVFNEGFQAFDITSAVKLWVQRQINGTVRLEITVTCFSSKRCAEDKQSSPASITYDFDSSVRNPRLVIVSQNPLQVARSATDRVKRQSDSQASGGTTTCRENQSTCCLKKLTLDFVEDLGMDFVILPKQFEANYCEGICPITAGGELMTPDLYSFITKLTNHPAASLEPCCAGNTFKPLVIVLVDPANPDRTITEELQQVTVESCRCA